MSELKHFIMWSLILILCLMVLAVNVFIADSISKLPEKIEAGQITLLPEISPTVSDKNGFPYTVSYDGETVRVQNAKGTEVYSFGLTGYTLPESERKLLEEGITLESMDDVWDLIESYTS